MQSVACKANKAKNQQKTHVKQPSLHHVVYVPCFACKTSKNRRKHAKHDVKHDVLYVWRRLQSKQEQKHAKNPCETTIFTSCRIRPLFCLQNKQKSTKTCKTRRKTRRFVCLASLTKQARAKTCKKPM